MTAPLRRVLPILLLLAAVVVAACSAQTDPAGTVGPTYAYVNAHGTCDSGNTCTAWIQYEPHGSSTWFKTPSHTYQPGTITDSGLITGLQPGTAYDYEVCAQETSAGSDIGCFDSTGTGGTNYSTFTTATATDTYYVSAAGSDSNSGTSPSSAWRTVGHVNAQSLKPGDVVLFRGGDTFTDATLMTPAGGTSGLPVTFGTYIPNPTSCQEPCYATISQGAYTNGLSYVSYTGLGFGPTSGDTGTGIQGQTGDHLSILGNSIHNVSIAVNAVGSYWTVDDNQVASTGDSGMLLGNQSSNPGDPPGGHGWEIDRNTISNTGLNTALTQHKHCIYLKVEDSTVHANSLSNCSDEGISDRYEGNTLDANTISTPTQAIAYYEYDTEAGTTSITNNTISGTSNGIFVCGTAESCVEAYGNFTITGNHLGGSGMNLQPIRGTYTVNNNN